MKCPRTAHLIIAVLSVLVATGCDQTTFTLEVERHRLAVAPGVPRDATAALRAVIRYRDLLTGLNRIDAQLADRPATPRTALIRQEFQPLIDALGAVIAVPDEPRLRAAALREWLSLQARLLQVPTADQDLVTSPDAFRDKLNQLQQRAATPAAVERLRDCQQLAAELSEQFQPGPQPDNLITFLELVKDEAARADAAVISATGLPVQRQHRAVQDLSRPEIRTLLQDPAGWEGPVHTAEIRGIGDVDMILIFNDPLDAHWHAVTVDPSRLVSARLRFARAIARTAVAIAGVLTGTVPPAVALGLDAGDVTTATSLQLRESELRRRRERLQRLAATIGSELALLAASDPESRTQQAERLQSRLQAELQLITDHVASPPTDENDEAAAASNSTDDASLAAPD